jgi:hypothetical protein
MIQINTDKNTKRRDVETRCFASLCCKTETNDKVQGTSSVRHCGLDLQSPFIRFIRREASRLYILGDSDFRQHDGYLSSCSSSNPENPDSDRKWANGRKGEGAKGRMDEWTCNKQILVPCSLFLVLSIRN